MTDITTQIKRAQRRVEAERDEALLKAKGRFLTFNRLTNAQFIELYRIYIAQGYIDDYLLSDRSKLAFLEWAITPPIDEVINDH